jgi:threonine/homoserine/homoserine lactone efflux protein
MKRMLPLLLLMIAFALLPGDAFSQCAMCKATAESSAREGSTASAGLNLGILYLVTIPYLLLGSLIFVWWKYFRQRRSA